MEMPIGADDSDQAMSSRASSSSPDGRRQPLSAQDQVDPAPDEPERLVIVTRFGWTTASANAN